MTTETLRLLTPEIVLVAAATAIYLGGAYWTLRRAWCWMAGAAVALAAALYWLQTTPPISVGPLWCDSLAGQGRWFALAAGAVLVLLASRPRTSPDASEYFGTLLLAVAGLMLVVEAGDLVLLFLGLEMISIPTYVLLYLGRRDAACQESTVKYFFLSILSSAILLYGLSFLYGAAGATRLTTIEAALGAQAGPAGFAMLAKLGLALVLAGLCFKIAAVPFHFYAPDVYQGNSYPNAALLSVVPKAAGLAAAARILLLAAPGAEPYSWQVVAAISVLTMTVGNVLALWQDDLRRLLAYSSIAHAGYMLIGLAVALAAGNASGPLGGVGAAAFYMAVYAAATLGAFAVLEYLGASDQRIDGVDELAGLGRTRPWAACMLAVCLFSLLGAWPMSGFWGKLLLFAGALNVDGHADAGLRWWFIGLAIVGVLNAAVAAAYYLRIVAAMYFRAPLAKPRAEGGAPTLWAAVVCTLLVVVLGVAPGPLMRATGRLGNPPAAAQQKPPPQSAPRPGVAGHPAIPLASAAFSACLRAAIIEEGGDNRMSSLLETPILPRKTPLR